ncbi:ketosamine-3-kinase [Callorhinchus milii]|uniref:protein-ribulosamine 3-kinase n=1 Tax=Callorhinchus milii TaxID=7868 RepID=V9KWY4_CALMI|nr:ketosamine-3-kinase [Callorhinchus milii]|eukprot:gi/632943663/ref/XP_007887069.1/ PREDICTED: ketosamine-3-kinase-like isoform X2 [Callorhinchus milii]
MEAALKRELDTTSLRPFGHGGGGGISEGQSFQTDAGTVFVKINHKSQARRMFDGELAGLDAILKTKTVKVPKPVKVIDLPDGGSTLVMEYLDMSSISKYMPDLGEQLADLHLSNAKLRESQNKEAQTVGKGAGQSEIQYIDKFGFHVVTCCGYLPQINDWQSDWVTFFARQRLETQLDMIEKEYGDRESKELWSKLQLKIPGLFGGMEITPALLHGDLWGGNVAQLHDGPVIFDPAAFYGHSEYELGIAGMFGGFDSSFYTAYHRKLPKAPGFEKRLKLYQLFHYLNHWNHFGTGYKGSSISIMKALVK